MEMLDRRECAALEISNIVTLIIAIITVGNIFLAGAVVFIERRDIGSTWAWLMVLFFVPVLGFIVYIFLGRQLKEDNFYKLSAEERDYLQSAVVEQLFTLNNRKDQEHLLRKYSELIRMSLQSSNAIVTTNNTIHIFTDGKEKFDALFTDIRNAKQEINIQYYIIRRDNLGKKLRDELTKKAKEGVKVRVLYDEIGSRRINRSFYRELISYGGEVQAFFPSIFRLINFRINNRNHRKLCIIDGEAAYIGGFNVGDEYLGLDPKMGYWRDTHFRIMGGAVEQIQGRFILDWNKASNQRLNHEPFAFQSRAHQDQGLDQGQSVVQIISSGPNSQTEHIKNMYIKLIMTAKKSVYIQTPYFIPDASFMDACKIALLSGVDVRIMIPNKPDHPFVYWATRSHVGELLSYGAKVLEYENGFLHAKTLVVDQEVASAGTANIDTRSFRLNFEVNALVYDAKVAKQLSELFLQDSKLCSEITLQGYQTRPIWAKIREAVARLLSPIL
jgi:cardiolipin synthase A/B